MKSSIYKGLSSEARSILREHGITAQQWIDAHFTGSQWGGDTCGCLDSRCIGYHHEEESDCQCLPQLIETYEETRLTK